MATGSFWNLDDPLKPWGLFDPDAELVLPFDITDWLADMAAPYASHVVIADPPLTCLASVHVSGVISVRMALSSSPTYTAGVKYPFTLRLTCAVSEPGTRPQKDDRTFWLKLKSR